jgi:hypothetical protein
VEKKDAYTADDRAGGAHARSKVHPCIVNVKVHEKHVLNNDMLTETVERARTRTISTYVYYYYYYCSDESCEYLSGCVPLARGETGEKIEEKERKKKLFLLKTIKPR